MKVTDTPTVKFNTDTMLVTVVTGKRGRPAHFGTLLSYTENVMRTPSGGSFLQRRITVKGNDGKLYTAQVRQGETTVKLRNSRKVIGVDNIGTVA